MEKYKNEEHLKSEIMGQSRHQFIYGYDGEARKQFLENMVMEYPIVLDERSPMGIYVNEYGLPKIALGNENVDKSKINIISSEFLNFSIARNILLKARSTNDLDVLNERIIDLLDNLNNYSINRGHSQVRDLDDLIRILTESKEFYKKYYIEYYGKGMETSSLDELAMPFMPFDMFVGQLKSAINNSSYFGVIIDKQDDIALSSTKAINGLVAGRINKDISMKIATEPDGWDSYHEVSGQVIQRTDDYGTIELDASHDEYLKKLKSDRQ